MDFTGERYVPELYDDIRYEHLHRYALALDFVPGKRVLDIASGEGYGSGLLALHAASVIGVDIDAGSVQHASQKYSDLPNVEFRVGSCDSIPLQDGSVDVVVSFETLEHHDKHDEMMQEVKRVLTPGGVLVMSSPNRLVYSDEPNYKNPYHVKELYLEELSSLLHRYFQSVRIYGQQMTAASFVTPLSQTKEGTLRALTGSEDSRAICQRITHLERPLYFLSVNSDRAANVEGELSSVYTDAQNVLWQETFRHRSELARMYGEHEKLGGELHRVRDELIRVQEDLERKCATIAAMEGSIFWRLRNAWFRCRRLLRGRSTSSMTV